MRFLPTVTYYMHPGIDCCMYPICLFSEFALFFFFRGKTQESKTTKTCKCVDAIPGSIFVFSQSKFDYLVPFSFKQKFLITILIFLFFFQSELHTIEDIKMWLPSIKKDLDFNLKVW